MEMKFALKYLNFLFKFTRHRVVINIKNTENKH